MRRLFIFALLLLKPASAQVLQLAGGSSSLYQGAGGGITAYLPNSTVKLNAGTFQGQFGIGISDTFKFKGLDVTSGDSQFGFSVDGAGGVGIAVRGLSIERHSANRTLAGFVGSTGPSFYLPYFQANRSQHMGAGLFFRQRVNNWTFQAIVAFDGGKHTLLESAAYQNRWIRFNGGGGLLNGQKTAVGLIDFTPLTQLHFAAMRQDLFYRNEQASINSVSSFASLGHFNLNATALDGTSAGRHVSGETFGGGFHLAAISLQSGLYLSNRNRVLVNNATETLRHWHFSQSVTGRNSFGFGGGYHNNKFSISLDHSEAFLPFVGRGFQQVTSISFSIRLGHSTTLNLAASLLPDGPRYTASAEGYASGPIKATNATENPACRKLKAGRFIVRGVVQDPSGNPVPGATLRLGDATLITDATGRFYLRTGKVKPLRVHVQPSEFVAPGCWQVVDAPSTAIPGPDDSRNSIMKIVIRRMK